MFDKYSCRECDRHYVSYKGLWLHNRRYHPDNKLASLGIQCQYCDRVLQTNAAYQMHKQMHDRMLRQTSAPSNSGTSENTNAAADGDDTYHICQRCFKVFSSKYNLRVHMKSHGVNVSPARNYVTKNSKMFWCDTCHQACQGYAELQKHKQEHVEEGMDEDLDTQYEENVPEIEMKPEIFICDICTRGFTSKLALRKHKELHEQENGGQRKNSFVYCGYCKLPFVNADKLKEHVQKEHRDTNRPIAKFRTLPRKHVCKLCRKVFDTASALSSHQGWHKRSKFGKQLKNNATYYVEVKENSSPAPSTHPKHECASCNLSFLTDKALRIHFLQNHSKPIAGGSVTPHCASCNADFPSNQSYEQHVRLHHRAGDDAKPYPCSYCDKSFTRNDALNAHIRQFHNEHYKSSFQCHYCLRFFAKQNALTVHLKVHERQKITPVVPIKNPKSHVYSCSICHEGFDIPRDLKNHIITSHPF